MKNNLLGNIADDTHWKAVFQQQHFSLGVLLRMWNLKQTEVCTYFDQENMLIQSKD